MDIKRWGISKGLGLVLEGVTLSLKQTPLKRLRPRELCVCSETDAYCEKLSFFC